MQFISNMSLMNTKNTHIFDTFSCNRCCCPILVQKLAPPWGVLDLDWLWEISAMKIWMPRSGEFTGCLGWCWKTQNWWGVGGSWCFLAIKCYKVAWLLPHHYHFYDCIVYSYTLLCHYVIMCITITSIRSSQYCIIFISMNIIHNPAFIIRLPHHHRYPLRINQHYAPWN